MADNNFFGVKKGLRFKPSTLPVSGNLGEITYDSATNSFKQWTGTTWGPVTGSGSGKNFITGGDAEAGTTGWSTYADAAASRPVDGTGGSPTVTFTTTATAPLIDANSFLFTKDAANRQGEGVSFSFTIDSAYKAKVLQISMDYIVNSGTFVSGTNTTDSDLIVYLYDVTNSQLIEPSSIKFLSNSSTLSDKFNATFQTSATGTQYRLILHCASTSASAYSLKFDDIKVTPSTYVYGTPVTDWQSYTPTVAGLGTISNEGCYWRRVGDSIEIKGTIVSGTATASVVSIQLPSGLAIDANKNPSTTDSSSHGLAFNLSAVANYSGTGAGPFIIHSDTATANNLLYIAITNTASRFAKVVGTTLGSTARIRFEAKDIPILGWSSSVQMSDQADTRVVGLRARRTTAATAITGTSGVQYDVIYNVTDNDSHGTFNGTTWTCAVAGYYKVNASVAYAAGSTVGFRSILFVKNGSTVSQKRYVPGASVIVDVCNDDLIYFNVGDTFKINVLQNSGTTVGLEQADANVNLEQVLTITRMAGPSAIAATELVHAKYRTTAAQSIANNSAVVVDFATKVDDTHGAVTTGASWKFTAPANGLYSIKSNIVINIGTTTAHYATMYIRKNSSNEDIAEFKNVGTSTAVSAGCGVTASTDIRLKVGDTIDLTAFQVSGAAKSLSTVGNENWVAITRIGL